MAPWPCLLSEWSFLRRAYGPDSQNAWQARRTPDGSEHVLALPIRGSWRVFLRAVREGPTRVQRTGLLHVPGPATATEYRPGSPRGQVLRAEPDLSPGLFPEQDRCRAGHQPGELG